MNSYYCALALVAFFSAVHSAPSKCEEHRENSVNLIGSWIPECDSFGYYADLQCHPSTGFCWCVRRDGTPITEQIRGQLHCTCFREADTASNGGLIGAFVPKCQSNGLFEKKQCWGSTGSCWCVDEVTGMKGSHGSVHHDVTCD